MAVESFDVQTINKLAELGAESAGELVHSLITAPPGAVGVPKEIPGLIRKGAKPEFIAPHAIFEQYRSAPERRSGTAVATTLESFEMLVARHKDDHSVIFAETRWPKPRLLAVIDYHQTDHVARFGKHRVEYAFPVTEEFKAWVANNDQAMEQAEFAAFLEDHAAELAAPLDAERGEYEPLFRERFATPTDLIALSRNLEVYVGARVKRGERLSSGERTVEFVEEHSNSKGEKVEIPGIFMISVPAFIDGDSVRIPARLRYRIGAGNIHWFYSLYRWEYWLRVQVQSDMLRAAKTTDTPAYEGAPEA